MAKRILAAMAGIGILMGLAYYSGSLTSERALEQERARLLAQIESLELLTREQAAAGRDTVRAETTDSTEKQSGGPGDTGTGRRSFGYGNFGYGAVLSERKGRVSCHLPGRRHDPVRDHRHTIIIASGSLTAGNPCREERGERTGAL